MKFLISLFLFVFCSSSIAQIVNERAFFFYENQKEIYQKGSQIHTAFKSSFLDSSIKSFPLIISKKTNSIFQVAPIVDLSIGNQNQKDKTTYELGYGAELNFIRKKWNSGFTYVSKHARYMNYQTSLIQDNRVVPGMNVANGKKLISADYFSGYINFRANKTFNFELGYGRNFIGDGYRSLLLSDAGNASPYLKITTNFWKFQYTNLFASHQNIYNVEGEQSLYRKKYSATHYLDYKATKWLSIGLFETIIWQAKEANYTRGFDPNYANPFIFYRPVEFSVGSSDNALIGANLKFTLFKNHIIYSQLILDEFLLKEIRADISQFRNPEDDIQSGWWANKYGVQFGWTAFDFLKIKGLQTRIEFNLVRPYTYAHSSPTQAYSNYNLSLAHPLGANFHEFVSIINYQKNNWWATFKFNQSRKGISPIGEYFGDNIQLSNQSRSREYENSLTQGTPVFTQYAETSFGYLLSKSWNTSLSIGFIWREQKIADIADVNNMLVLRFKTNIYNQYFDY